MVGIIRELWNAVEEKAKGTERAKLQRDIAQSLHRLKGRIEKNLALSRLPTQERLLFNGSEAGSHQHSVPVKERLSNPRFPEPISRIYDKDLVEHALSLIPAAINFRSVEDYRDYLINKIRYNSQATRRRAANYLIGRYFPGDTLHSDLIEFAAKTAGKPALSDALFYLTCRMEPIVAAVAEEVIFPSLPEGGVARGRVLEFVQAKFPGSKSVPDMSQAIIRTYERFGVGSATKARLNVSLREGSLAAFGYVLHLEFPEPGMHSFERLFKGPLHRWLLWDQQWMVRQLYSLREAGILSKVSEIDGMRQFTTKFALDDVVCRLVNLPEEAHP